MLVGSIFVVLLVALVISTGFSSAGISVTWESDALSLRLQARMVFPKGSVAVLDRASFNIYDNGNPLGEVSVITFAPSAGQTFLVTTQARFLYSNLQTMVGSYLTHAGSVIWRIAGDATFNTVVGAVQLPLDITSIPYAWDFYPILLIALLLLYGALAAFAYRKGYL